jgi:hypothetical protein
VTSFRMLSSSSRKPEASGAEQIGEGIEMVKKDKLMGNQNNTLKIENKYLQKAEKKAAKKRKKSTKVDRSDVPPPSSSST